jgi:hypothetical protein
MKIDWSLALTVAAGVVIAGLVVGVISAVAGGKKG